MPDTELFLSLAEIAGVFVGFGALIVIRSGRTSDVFEVTSISQVVEYGIMVVVVALVPIAINQFGISDHALWWVCSLVALALFWGGDEVLRRVTPERRAALEWFGAAPARWRGVVYVWTLAEVIPMTLAWIVILVGVRPDLDAALYFAALAILLLIDAVQLLWTVIGVGFPRPAPDADALPAGPA